MAKASPKQALARNIEQSVSASVAKRTVALHLSREEWAWVVAGLRLAAEAEKAKGGGDAP